MTKHWRKFILGAFITCIAGSTWAAATGPVNLHAAAIDDFNKRVKAYVDLHKKAESGLPPLKKTANPDEIKAAERALGDAIRAARANAHQGDIFTPEAAPILREMVTQYYKQHPAVSTRKEMLDEVPVFKPAVNQIYPEKLAKASMPPDLLKTLPALPATIVEYRIVATYLTLRDVQANLIVDFIPNALPPAAKKQEDKQ